MNGVYRVINTERITLEIGIQLLQYRRQFWVFDICSISLINSFFTKKNWWRMRITILGIEIRFYYK